MFSVCYLVLLPLLSPLYCYKNGLDSTHVDKTDRLPSLPMNLQNHNCLLLGILKARTQTHTDKWVERFLLNLILPWLSMTLLLAFTLLSFPVPSCSSSCCRVLGLKSFPRFQYNWTLLVSLSSSHSQSLLKITLNSHTFLSSIFISWNSIEVATEAAGAIGVVFGQRQSYVGSIIDGNREAKLFAPELIKTELWACKHSVRCIGQRQSAKMKTDTSFLSVSQRNYFYKTLLYQFNLFSPWESRPSTDRCSSKVSPRNSVTPVLLPSWKSPVDQKLGFFFTGDVSPYKTKNRKSLNK